MKATLKNFKQSPRKVRPVAKVLRGKRVAEALAALHAIDKKVSDPLRKLILSAVHNAQQAGTSDADNLAVASVEVNHGLTLKRWRPRAFGRATPIRRRSSTIQVALQHSK